MDYQYRYWYENSWPWEGLAMPKRRSLCEDRCYEELRRLEEGFYREMGNLRRYMFPGDNYFYRMEHDITSYYYTQRDRINEYWKRQEYYEQRGYYGSGYRDYLAMFSNPVYYQTALAVTKTTPLQLENKNMPTEKKKYIVVRGLDAGNAEFSNHDTLAEAEKEAQQNARDNEGEEYIIFESKKSYKIAGPPLEEKVFI